MTAPTVEGRACLTCGTFKPWTDFPLGKGTNGHRGHCKPCHSRRNASWNKQHPHVGRAASNRHYARNADRIVQRVLRWKRENPGGNAEIQRRRRARTMSAAGVDYTTADMIRARFDLYGGMCFYCRTSKATQADHRLPLSRGGSHWPSNIVPSCQRCNASKNAKHPLDFTKEVSPNSSHAHRH